MLDGRERTQDEASLPTDGGRLVTEIPAIRAGASRSGAPARRPATSVRVFADEAEKGKRYLMLAYDSHGETVASERFASPLAVALALARVMSPGANP